MYKPELAYRSDGPERGTRNEGLYMRSPGMKKTLGPFRRFVSHSACFLSHYKVDIKPIHRFKGNSFNSESCTEQSADIVNAFVFIGKTSHQGRCFVGIKAATI